MPTNNISLLAGHKPANSVNELSAPFRRAAKASLNEVPGSLPTGDIPLDIVAADVAQWGISQMSSLTAEVSAENCLWRDLYALTGLP